MHDLPEKFVSFFYVFVFIGHFFYCPDCCDTVNRRYPCQLFFHSTPRILPPLHPLRWHYQYRLSLWTSLLLSWIIQESVRPLWWYLSVLDEYVISYEKTENFALCHLVACPCHISCLNVCGCCFKVYDDEGVMVMDIIIYSKVVKWVFYKIRPSVSLNSLTMLLK